MYIYLIFIYLFNLFFFLFKGENNVQLDTTVEELVKIIEELSRIH
jgi:hypothetical protein